MKSIVYDFVNKQVASNPVIIQCRPKESVNGSMTFPNSMNTFSATLRAVTALTGTNTYVQSGPNYFTGSIAGITGMDRVCSVSVDTSLIKAPTGAIDGETYGLKVSAGATGVFQIKTVADVIVKVIAEFK